MSGESSVLQIYDDGNLSVNNSFGLSNVVTSHGSNVNGYSMSFVYPTMHVWIDTWDMGTIPHYDSSAPASATAGCVVGEVYDDTTYHYACVTANTWRRVAWDTSFK